MSHEQVQGTESFEEKKKNFFVRLGRKYGEFLNFHEQSGQTKRDKKFGKEKYKDSSGNERERNKRWGDPTQHCLVETAIAELAADECGLSEQEKETLAVAAVVHDWRKRGEIEETRGEKDPQKIEESYKKSKDIILHSGIKNAELVTKLTESVAHTSLPDMAVLNKDNTVSLKENVPILEIMMHYIDDVTRGTDVVTLDERMDYLDSVAATRYPYNEGGKAIWGGRTFFEAQREIGHLIENELVKRMNEKGVKLENPKDLPIFLREKLMEKINGMNESAAA